LLKCLLAEGRRTYKESIVETLMKIGNEGTSADKEQVLLTFCEYIEDCDNQHLQTHIMDYIAKEAENTENPSVYIRFIYNRVVLEKSTIRASACSALGEIGHRIPSLRDQIIILLKNCLKDENDEVRERALWYTSLLEASEENEEDKQAEDFVFDSLNFDFAKMEQYLVDNKDTLLENEDDEKIFDLETFYTDEEAVPLASNINLEPKSPFEEAKVSDIHSPLEESIENIEEKGKIEVGQGFTLSQKDLGKIGVDSIEFSTDIENITSHGDEYFIQVTKHFSGSFLIFQFNVVNNIEEHKLSNVKVHLEHPRSAYKTITQISSEETSHPIVVLQPTDSSRRFITDELKFKLTFTIIEVDEDGNEEGDYEDEYSLEKIRISVSDYVGKQELPNGQFMNAWEAIKQNEDCTERMETFQINFNTMKEAVAGVIKFFSMSVCENSQNVDESSKVHNLFLAGTFYGSFPVLIRAQIGFNSQYGCVLRVGIRSMNEDVMQTVLECIQ
jgi:coatomer protein complex subunit gamma